MNSLSKLILSELAGTDFIIRLSEKKSGATHPSRIKSFDWNAGILAYHDTIYNASREINVEELEDLVEDRDDSFVPGAARHSGDVNPFTGTCPRSVELATLIGNEGRGPVFDLAISHQSAGKGSVANWAPCVTFASLITTFTYEITTRKYLEILTVFMSDGQFLNIVAPGLSGLEASLSRAGLAIFPVDNDIRHGFNLVHKDGTVEVLRHYGSETPSASNFYLPARIVSPQGHSLLFQWKVDLPAEEEMDGPILRRYPALPVHLVSISDASRTLVQATYSLDSTLAMLEVNPGTTQACTHNFIVENKKLQAITSNSKDLVTKRTFRYETFEGKEQISEISHAVIVAADGAKEVVNMSTTTMIHENGRVRTCTVKLGAQGTAQNTNYVYKPGATGLTTIVTSGSEIAEYSYDAEGKLTRTVLTNGACSRDISYTTLDDENTGRRTFTTTTTLASGDNKRVEVSIHEVDAYGNLVRQTIGGVTTEWTYYRGEPRIEEVVTGTKRVNKVSGTHGVFGAILDYANPVGLTNQLFGKQGLTWGTLEDRAVVRHPWVTNDGKKRFNLPIDITCEGNPNYTTVHVESEKVFAVVDGKRSDLRWTFYGYSGFAVDGSVARGPWLMPSVKLTIHRPRSADGIKLDAWHDSAMELERTDYHADAKNVAFGRACTVTQVMLDSKGAEVPLSLHKAAFSYKCEANELVTTVTIDSPATDEKGTATTTKQQLSQTVSVLSGEKLRVVDLYGSTTEYSYDSAGRLIARADNAQDEAMKRTSTYEYALSAGGWQTTVSLPGGEQQRELTDFAGCLLSVEYRVSASAPWLLVSSTSYDALGRINSETEIDYKLDYDKATKKSGGTKLCAVTRNLSYDGWGHVSMVETVGGATRHIEYDPLGCKLTEWEASGTYVGPKNVQSWDGDGRVTRTEQSNGSSVFGTSFKFDAFGQVSEETSDFGESIGYAYDNFGRLVSVQSTGATGVSGKYAFSYPKHSSEASVSRIAVDMPGGAGERVLGSRTLDSLGRTTECTTGGRTQAFSYEGGSLLGIGGVSLKSGRDVRRAAVQTQHEPLTGEVTEKSSSFTSIFSSELSFTSTWSLRGRLLKDDAGGVGLTTHAYDSIGRLISSKSEEVERCLSYDVGGRLSCETVSHVASKQKMSVTFQYDSFDREIERTFRLTGSPVLSLRRKFNDAGLIASADALQNDIVVRAEKFSYTDGGRLTAYECEGKEKPIDNGGKSLEKQTFAYDAIGNITRVESKFADGSDVATYQYDTLDVTQLQGVTHSSKGYQNVSLKYDGLGRLSEDNTHKYLYDEWGRLSEASPKVSVHGKFYEYYYDEAGRLVGGSNSADIGERFHYCGSGLRAAYAIFPEGSAYWFRKVRLMNQSEACVCLASTSKKSDTGVETACSSFEVLDARGSLVARYDLADKTLTHFSYTPYGYRPVDGKFVNWMGFAGETVDHFFGRYHPGGYRVYDPALGRFQEPDGLSPFDVGGPNGYAYCSGDPVNLVDPSGHAEVIRRYSVLTHEPLIYDPVVQAVLYGGIGVMLAPFTGGGSLYLTTAAVGLAAVSAGFGIAAAVLEKSDPALAKGLGWASVATGVASGAAGLLYGLGRAGLAKLGSGIGNLKTFAAGSTARLSAIADDVSASTARVAYRNAPVRMGGTMRALEQVEGDLYTFVDNYKKGVGNRLNIAVHGEDLDILQRLTNSSNVVALTVNGNTVPVSAKELLTRLQKVGIHPSTYEHVRLLICYGGSGGGNSFAAQFQSLMGRPVKAYQNAIWMNFGSTLMEPTFAQTASHAGRLALAMKFATSATHHVSKTNPFSLLQSKDYARYLLNPYKPVYFP